MVAVPAPAGVKTPAEVIVPPLAVQLTAALKLPVPATVAVQVLVCAVVMDVGLHSTVTEEIVTGMVTVTVVEPNFVESCVEEAVMVAVPAPAGVKTPELLTAPMLAGLTDQVTDEL